MMRGIYKERLDTLLEALDAELPWLEKSRPSRGGFYLSVRLPCNAERIAMEMMERGALILPASAFYVDKPDPRVARISVAKLELDAIERFVGILRETLLACRWKY